jgi:hypothetical protein
VIASPETEGMIEIQKGLGTEDSIPVFRRYELMKQWHDAKKLPFEAFTAPDRLHMNDWGYKCFAERLADAITDKIPPALRR